MYNLLAKSYELANGQCYIDGVLQATTDACTEPFKFLLGAGALFLALAMFLLVLGLIFFVFWIVMLVHAIQHEDITDRTIWLITLAGGLILGFTWLVAILYYIAVKRPYDSKDKQISTAKKRNSIIPANKTK